MKKVKSVAFNVADPMELALYEYALQHKYFSTYIKRLIQRDMENGKKIDLTPFKEASHIWKQANGVEDEDTELGTDIDNVQR